MDKNLPAGNTESNSDDDENGRRDGDRFLAINNLHLHGNDIAELRKLAEVSPELAEKVIEQRDRADARIAASYNFGVGATLALLALLLVAVVAILLFGGLLELFGAVAVILAAATLIRVVLTGEWSDTSWFGQVVNFIMIKLGGKKSGDDA